MSRAVVLILFGLFSALNNGCAPKITPQEAKVLVVLDEIQRAVDKDIEYDKFVQLLGTAKDEIDMLRQSTKPNPCFLNAAEKCYASYDIARKAWQKKMEAKDEKRKADMDMTLSFSLSFASINIQKANKCYK
jgi:hypothetical protein